MANLYCITNGRLLYAFLPGYAVYTLALVQLTLSAGVFHQLSYGHAPGGASTQLHLHIRINKETEYLRRAMHANHECFLNVGCTAGAGCKIDH